jgi:hypothetical protein
MVLTGGRGRHGRPDFARVLFPVFASRIMAVSTTEGHCRKGREMEMTFYPSRRGDDGPSPLWERPLYFAHERFASNFAGRISPDKTFVFSRQDLISFRPPGLWTG